MRDDSVTTKTISKGGNDSRNDPGKGYQRRRATPRKDYEKKKKGISRNGCCRVSAELKKIGHLSDAACPIGSFWVWDD